MRSHVIRDRVVERAARKSLQRSVRNTVKRADAGSEAEIVVFICNMRKRHAQLTPEALQHAIRTSKAQLSSAQH